MANNCCCWTVLHIGERVIRLEQGKNKQTEANKKWQEQNREKARYLRDRSTARNFITKKATAEDLLELEQLIKEKRDAIN